MKKLMETIPVGGSFLVLLAMERLYRAGEFELVIASLALLVVEWYRNAKVL